LTIADLSQNPETNNARQLEIGLQENEIAGDTGQINVASSARVIKVSYRILREET
jgi:hypothetical protein